MEKRKRYSRKFQRMAVERMKTCESVGELAKELGVTQRCLYKWRTKLEAVEAGEEASRPATHAGAHRKEILQLKRLLAEKAMEVDFLKGALQNSRGSTPAQQRFWREGIYEHIRELMPLQGRLSIEHMCQFVVVSRRGFYRSLRQREPAEEETEVRSLIQQIVLEHRRRYGYRRITAELQRRGVQIGRKKVARMMRDDNLLAIQPRRFIVTTNSKHKLEVYLNLASRMRLTGINQLWLADITYVRLKGGDNVGPHGGPLLDACVASMARPATQQRIKTLIERGFSKRGDNCPGVLNSSPCTGTPENLCETNPQWRP